MASPNPSPNPIRRANDESWTPTRVARAVDGDDHRLAHGGDAVEDLVTALALRSRLLGGLQQNAAVGGNGGHLVESLEALGGANSASCVYGSCHAPLYSGVSDRSLAHELTEEKRRCMGQG